MKLKSHVSSEVVRNAVRCSAYMPYSSFDRSCHALAVQWVDDQLNETWCEERTDIERLEADLAQTIQQAIEEWIEDREAKRPLLFEETHRASAAKINGAFK